MSNSNDEVSRSVAEKLFTDQVLERYLLTIKSGGMAALLSLVSETDHWYQMWQQYNDHNGDDGWVAKCDAARLCKLVMDYLIKIVIVKDVDTGETCGLDELGVGSGSHLIGAVIQEGGEDLLLKHLEPSCISVTRA
jgi:hypothetical protein